MVEEFKALQGIFKYNLLKKLVTEFIIIFYFELNGVQSQTLDLKNNTKFLKYQTFLMDNCIIFLQHLLNEFK